MDVDPCKLCCGACSSVLFIVAFIMLCPAYILQVHRLHYGLLKNTISGQVELNKVYTPGRYYVGFWYEFILFPQYLNTIEFSNDKPEVGVKHLSALRSRDKEGKQIWLDISVQYRLEQKNIGKLYKQYQMQYEDVFISELRDVLMKTGNNFNVAEIWTDYSKPVQAMKAACDTALKARYAECWGLQVWGVRLEDVYEDQLVKTQVRKQAQKTAAAKSTHENARAETEVLLADYRRDITVVEADGTAKKFKIERNATAVAEKMLTDAKADVLQIIRSTVKPSGVREMKGEELTTYVKLMDLETMTNSPLLYHPNNVLSASGSTGWTRRLGESMAGKLEI
jgi:regulator of protease activity HflC (stomatin/prohibitin superfamily)